MPRHVPNAELDSMVELVAAESQGIAIETLRARLGAAVPRRTLQRRLAALVAAGRLELRGRGPAARYHVAKAYVALVSAEPEVNPTPAALDGEARELEASIRRPLSQRRPVGYHRPFLDGYVPNRTHYLTKAAREKLGRLGRASSERPAGTYARDILGRLMIDLSWASSRLEGNTYTRLDTQNLIEFGQLATGKDQRETQMILNHKAAIEMLVDGAEVVGFDRYTFLNLHALLAENLLTDSAAAGRLRTIPVEISGTTFVPLAIPQQIEEYFDRLLARAAAIRDPFEQAFFVMVHVPYLQPFEDVNKRVSRLAANIPFVRDNLAPLSFVDMPETGYLEGITAVYEHHRTALLAEVFVAAYERSSLRYVAVKESLPAPDPLRLRLREVLIELVGDVVREGRAIDLADLRTRAAPLVPSPDLDQFAAMAFNDLHHLHEGNLARYRLRLSELRRWKSARPR